MSYTQEQLEEMETALAEKEAPLTFRDFLCSNKECQFRFCLSVPTDQTYVDWKGGPQVVCPSCGGHQDRSAMAVLDMGDWCFTDEVTLDGSGPVEQDGPLAEMFEKHERLQTEVPVETYPPLPTPEQIAAMKAADDGGYKGSVSEAYDQAAAACTKQLQQQAEAIIFSGEKLAE